MRYAFGTAALIGALAFGLLCFHMSQDADSLTVSAMGAIDHVSATMTDARRVLEITGGTLNIARDTMRSQQKTVQAESQQILEMTRNVNALTVQASTTLRNMDANSAKSLDQLTDALKSIPPAIAATQDTVQKIGVTVDSVNKVVAGPVMGTMTNVQDTSKTLNTYIKTVTTPKGFLSTLWHGLMELASPAVTLAK